MKERSFKKIIIALMLSLTLCFSLNVQIAQAATAKASTTKKTIYVKETFTIQLLNVSSKSSVKWSTSNGSVASIKKISNIKYKVTAKKAGKTVITAKLGNRKYTCTVTVKSLQDKLKDKITKNGKLDSNKNRYLTITKEGVTFSITYNKSKNNYKFAISCNLGKVSCTQSMTYSSKSTKLTPTLSYTDKLNNYSFTTKATFNRSSYKKNTKLSFKLTNQKGNNGGLTTAYINDLSNTFLQSGFIGWDYLLAKNVGLNISDLGFSAYK